MLTDQPRSSPANLRNTSPAVTTCSCSSCALRLDAGRDELVQDHLEVRRIHPCSSLLPLPGVTLRGRHFLYIGHHMSTSQTTGDAAANLQRSDVDKHLDEYVNGELDFLSGRATLFEQRATLWYRIVGFIMALAVGFAMYRAYKSSELIANLSWQEVVRTIASSLIVIALLSGMARFAFIMGKSFMVEAIRNNNRRHAITFGQFYLKAFRQNITWPETRDAFRSWNIDIGSSFLTQNPEDIDPQLIQSIVAIVNAVGNKAKGKE